MPNYVMEIHVCLNTQEICLISLNLTGKMEILETVITKFQGDGEKFYCSFYCLLQGNLLPSKFGGDMTLTNILLAEIGNQLLPFFSKSECKLHENPLSAPKIPSERSEKFTVYCWVCSSQMIYQISLSFLRIKIVNTPSSVLQFHCVARLIQTVNKL